jgi:hypothetical protein
MNPSDLGGLLPGVDVPAGRAFDDRGQRPAALTDQGDVLVVDGGDHRIGSDRPTQHGGVGHSWSHVESPHCGSWQPHRFGVAVR